MSLLEYRKRKQSSGRDHDPAVSSSSLGVSASRPSSFYCRDTHQAHYHQLTQHPADASHQSYPSTTHRNPIPQIEDVSPPDPNGLPVKSTQPNNKSEWWGDREMSFFCIEVSRQIAFLKTFLPHLNKAKTFNQDIFVQGWFPQLLNVWGKARGFVSESCEVSRWRRLILRGIAP